MASNFEVVFLGTGSPLPNMDRCGAGQVIIANGTHIMVDCGWGAARRLMPAGIMPSLIDVAVFTHMHTDHMTDVPDFLFLRWTSGAKTPLRVYGPDGTREMIEGFLMALRRDIGFRQAHHGDKLHPDGIKVEVIEIPTPETRTEFFSEQGIRIEAFEVDHFPVVPAFGYRAAFDGRSVVLSGDTTFCPPLLEASHETDMLICEAMNVPMLEARKEFLRASGRGLQAELFGDIPTYHIATPDVARLARDAGVGELVLSHLIPPIGVDDASVKEFAMGMDQVFPGPITVAKDMQRIPIVARRTA